MCIRVTKHVHLPLERSAAFTSSGKSACLLFKVAVDIASLHKQACLTQLSGIWMVQC